MTNNQLPSSSDSNASTPGVTSIARVVRGMRGVGLSSMQRRDSFPATENQERTHFDQQVGEEILRQDANPDAYKLPTRTPEQLAEHYNLPVVMTRGLGTEA